MSKFGFSELMKYSFSIISVQNNIPVDYHNWKVFIETFNEQPIVLVWYLTFVQVIMNSNTTFNAKPKSLIVSENNSHKFSFIIQKSFMDFLKMFGLLCCVTGEISSQIKNFPIKGKRKDEGKGKYEYKLLPLPPTALIMINQSNDFLFYRCWQTQYTIHRYTLTMSIVESLKLFDTWNQ